MESLQEIFNKVCEYCIENRQFTQIAYETWLKEATLYSIENNYSTAVIHAKSEFSQNVIETKLKDKLAVGSITNMYRIAQILTEADRLVTL